ncbi:MAG: cryptochrome/photolyase family protein [Chthoniobacterales bacterium]|nr:cryptochrome/photolyase family protein [Chthoniobacterales bacterium]
MKKLIVILKDQLSFCLSSLKCAHQATDTLFFYEFVESSPSHHQKKIAFWLACMRHFASTLQEQGFQTIYIPITEDEKPSPLIEEMLKVYQKGHYEKIIITEPSEWSVLEEIKKLQRDIPIEILPDDRFLATKGDFQSWANGKKQLRMEYFYREMRRKHHILIDTSGKPEGGKWNFDQENRKPFKGKPFFPKRLRHQKSSLLQEVLALVEKNFSHHFGTLQPFHYAVTREEALLELEDFIQHALPFFGDNQDAMVASEPYLYHSLLSSYLNIGLLLPLEICEKAQEAYYQGKAPLNAVEGFIRQILGWREFIRGIYWLYMPNYGELNFLKATRALPSFYWTGSMKMFCMQETVNHTKEHAYSHHIQRLMITGNFALLAGLNVKEVQQWYLGVYSDAYEWVEMPNTLGMALFGDGGIVGSKPYAASGKYIHRMSNYCQKCCYDPNLLTGNRACPFNALYWDFMARHAHQLQKYQRMNYMLSTWNHFPDEKKEAIQQEAKSIFYKMEQGEL